MRRGLHSIPVRFRALAPALAGIPILTAAAQDLEPRAYSNIPLGVNFALVGYGYTDGNVLTDAAIPIKDAEISAHNTFVAYARSLNLWGDSGKIDAVIPYGWLSGSATYAGQSFDRAINGFADPALRLT